MWEETEEHLKKKKKPNMHGENKQTSHRKAQTFNLPAVKRQL